METQVSSKSVTTPRSSERLEIDSLRALCAIEAHGGITRAAVFLGLSQSAVSHKIRRLEENLDCDLLSRRSNAPLFTNAGQGLLGYAKRILGIHDEALQNLSKSPLNGIINLGVTEDTARSDVSRILTRFRRLYPEVSMCAKVRQSLDALAMLATGEIDVAIVQVFKHEIRPSDTVLLEDRLHWVKSRDLQLSGNTRVPFLSFDENSLYSRWAMDVGQEDGTVLDTVLECASTAGIVTGVIFGLGVALLCRRHLTADMEIIDDQFAAPPDVAYIVRIARNSPNDVVDSLVREINLEVSRHGTLGFA